MKTTLKKIDRPSCQIIRALAEFAIRKAIDDRFDGLNVSLTPGTFTPTNFRFKVEINTPFDFGQTGVDTDLHANEDSKNSIADKVARAADDFRSFSYQHGLKPDNFGKKFTFRKRTYEIVGYLPQSSKFPILGKRVPDGKIFKFQVKDVKATLIA